MYTRTKLRLSWQKLLKQDFILKENGFNKRLFKQSDVYTENLTYWEYPRRTIQRSWKSQSKKRKQWER